MEKSKSPPGPCQAIGARQICSSTAGGTQGRFTGEKHTVELAARILCIAHVCELDEGCDKSIHNVRYWV